MILGSYQVEVIDLDKCECSYYDNIIRLGKRSYIKFYPLWRTPHEGTYVYVEGKFPSELYAGNYVWAGKFVCLDQKVANFYG